jgi:CheY-like chemotaxis protein
MTTPDKPLPLLLIEDDDNDVYLFGHALKKSGLSAKLSVVHDGQEALDYFQGIAPFSDRNIHPLPVLTFLDLNLPRMHGLEFLQSLRKTSLDHSVIIVLTSSAAELDIREAYNLGANSYLVKPSEPRELIEILNLVANYWRSNRLPSSSTPSVY